LACVVVNTNASLGRSVKEKWSAMVCEVSGSVRDAG
jgi:hypothetical protein